MVFVAVDALSGNPPSASIVTPSQVCRSMSVSVTVMMVGNVVVVACGVDMSVAVACGVLAYSSCVMSMVIFPVVSALPVMMVVARVRGCQVVPSCW